jgi:hypothetical protein
MTWAARSPSKRAKHVDGNGGDLITIRRCPIWAEFLASSLDSISVFRANPLLSKQFHHGDPENTERVIYFFVYREMPIDENNLSNQIYDTSSFMAN